MQINEEVEMTVEEFKTLLETEGGIYEVESPNGWVEVNEFYNRGERESLEVTTKSGSLKCSSDHLLFNKKGEWVKAEDLSIGDELRKKDSIEQVEKIKKLGKIQVYDIWVNSVEHAYFSNDFISHNCGKTEFAKTLAAELGIGFTKLDMSEYQEEYSVSKLIGASAGYVGYEQAGALTEPLIKNPNQVILLDEIEKANHSVYDLLLQAMDDGKLTDNHGREASFKNAILIFTSNVGCANADQMSSSMGFVKSASDETQRRRKAVEDAYKKKFSPEFRNRITEAFYFTPLSNDVLKMIVDKNIRRIQNSLADRNVKITITDKAKEWIAGKAAEEKAGGRPVERIVNSEISEKLADEVLFGVLSENGGVANVLEKDGRISVEFAKEKSRKSK